MFFLLKSQGVLQILFELGHFIIYKYSQALSQVLCDKRDLGAYHDQRGQQKMDDTYRQIQLMCGDRGSQNPQRFVFNL